MNLENKPRKDLIQIANSVKELQDRFKFNKVDFVYPSSGAYSRDKYVRQLEFFRAGKDHRFRLFIGANGTGKSHTGAVEFVYHATGQYPDWWEGRRLKKPKAFWIVAETGELYKDSLQKALFGNPGEEVGTGLIPKDAIMSYGSLPGTPGGIGSAIIKHKDGHTVAISVKTSKMERESLQAANLDLILFDEEPPMPIYSECIMRLRGSPTKPPGISMLLYTPLKGLSEVTLKYLPNGQFPEKGQHPEDEEKYVVQVTWDDCPHLTEKDKKAMLAEMSPHEREARSRGIPALGSGKVYPIFEDDIIVAPFLIPDHWPRAYGLDFGWEKTAALWGAKDPHTGILYLYGEYKGSKQAPYVHSYAIQSRGKWIPGISDPSGGGTNMRDGRQLVDEYRALGLNLTPGDNAKITGIARNLGLLESGMCKVFSTLTGFLNEFRIYRYDATSPNEPARGQEDHYMDAWKYLTSTFDWVATTQYDIDEQRVQEFKNRSYKNRDPLTGY